MYELCLHSCYNNADNDTKEKYVRYLKIKCITLFFLTCTLQLKIGVSYSIPIINCSTKRTFSKLACLKNKNRTRSSQEIFTNLIIFSSGSNV